MYYIDYLVCEIKFKISNRTIDLTYDDICLYLDACKFVAIPKSDCPCNDVDGMSGCSFLPKCSNNLQTDALCRKSRTMLSNITDINNCPFGYDVFKCSRGRNNSFP